MSLETAIDDDEKWFSQYDHVVWVDDVAQYQCTRCHKVLVQHYISNCQHKFCSNCKRILDDGSQKWRCPDCKEFIKDLGRQDLKFKDTVGRLRLHCPHRKYGCEHICPFQDLKMLERMFTMQMQELRKEMKREMRELEEKCLNRDVDAEQKGVNESAWGLSVEMDQMKRNMVHIIKKQKDGKKKLRVNLSQVNDRIGGVKSDLVVDTTRLRNEINELQKQAMRSDSSALDGISLAVEENKAKILKLETKTETWKEIMDFKDRKNNDLKHELKNEFKDELKTHKINFETRMKLFEQTINLAQEVKWAETNDKVKGVSHTLNEERKKNEQLSSKVNKTLSENNKLNSQIENLSQDLFNQQRKCRNAYEKSLAEINDFNVKVEKIREEVEKIREEVNNNKTKVEKEKMTQQVEFLKQELDKSATKCDNMANQQILPLNSAAENIILDQKIFLQLECLFTMKNLQMNMFTLAEDEKTFKPDFCFRVISIKYRLQNLPFEDISKSFEWPGYPVSAQIEVRVSRGVCVDLSLRLTTGRNSGNATEMRIIPHVYYVLKYAKEKCQPKHLYIVKSYEFATKFNHSLAFNSQTFFSDDFTDASSFMSDAFEVDIYVEPPSMAQHVHSYNGTLTWGINNFRIRKQMASGSLVQKKYTLNEYFVPFHESPYFYTGPRGYRVQVRMWVGNGLRAEINFLQGEFDVELPLAFPHRTTVTLFNRKNLLQNIIKTVTENNQQNKHYIMDVCNDKEVENMLENDRIFYKVTIEPYQD